MSRPRFVAQPTGHHDRLGLPEYAVIDTRYEQIEETWVGYFAPQDAHAAARQLNEPGQPGGPEEDHGKA